MRIPSFVIAISIFVLCGLAVLPALAEEKAADWEDTLRSAKGTFSVSVRKEDKKVEVKRIEGKDSFPYLRLRVLRPQDRPLEVRLKALEGVAQPAFAGHLSHWNDSYLGVELEFSFDRKTWQKLGKVLRGKPTKEGQ